jgi:hypothetical protein
MEAYLPWFEDYLEFLPLAPPLSIKEGLLEFFVVYGCPFVYSGFYVLDLVIELPGFND